MKSFAKFAPIEFSEKAPLNKLGDPFHVSLNVWVVLMCDNDDSEIYCNLQDLLPFKNIMAKQREKQDKLDESSMVCAKR